MKLFSKEFKIDFSDDYNVDRKIKKKFPFLHILSILSNSKLWVSYFFLFAFQSTTISQMNIPTRGTNVRTNVRQRNKVSVEQFLQRTRYPSRNSLVAIMRWKNMGGRQVARDATFKATLKGETLDARWNCARQRKRVNICDSKRLVSNKIHRDRSSCPSITYHSGTISRKQLIVHQPRVGNEFSFIIQVLNKKKVFKKKE